MCHPAYMANRNPPAAAEGYAVEVLASGERAARISAGDCRPVCAVCRMCHVDAANATHPPLPRATPMMPPVNALPPAPAGISVQLIC
jgi:hypothetical protein